MTSRVTSYSRAIRSQSSPAGDAARGTAANGTAAAPSKVLRSNSIRSLRSNPDIAQIIRAPALAARLRTIAGFNPAAGRFEEVLRTLGPPFELMPVALHHHQRPDQIGRVIGREPELAGGVERGREQV